MGQDIRGKVTGILIDRYAPPEMQFDQSYPHTDWIESGDYIGQVEALGVTCFYYRHSESDSTNSRAVREAWVDPATRRPLAIRETSGAMRFTHSTPYSNSLVLPNDFQEAIDHYKP